MSKKVHWGTFAWMLAGYVYGRNKTWGILYVVVAFEPSDD